MRITIDFQKYHKQYRKLQEGDKNKTNMNQLFLDIIHEKEVLNEATLDTLKGGKKKLSESVHKVIAT